MLTAGREQLYLERFYQDLAYDTEAIGPDAIQRYVRAFSQPGAMRTGFELYRAFPADDAHNRSEVKRDGKLTMPVLALAGVQSAFASFTEAMMREVVKDVTFRTVERANDWIPEENAEGLVREILGFVGPP